MKTFRKLLLPLFIAATLAVTIFALAISASAESNCPLKGEATMYGDANGDGAVNNLDLAHLAQYLANYDEETETSTVRLGPKNLGHEFNRKNISEAYLASPATCTEPARYYYACACGEVGTETFAQGSALGHAYSETEIVPPTCTEQGHTVYTCSRCGDSYVTYSDALGHNYDAVVTPPTCTERGYTTHTCIRCGDAYMDSYTAVLGHNYYETVIPPTCTEQGYTAHICSRCGDSYVDSYIDAVGHDYDDGVCTRCGDTAYSKGLSYVSNGDGTCTVTGIGTCTDTKISISPVTPAGVAVTSIGRYAFLDCKGLTSITIPDSVTSIGDGAFNNCTGLTSITIPDSVTSIDRGVFYNCTGLTSVTWNAINCTSAGSSFYPIFSGCTNLTTVTIGEEVTNIPAYAFYNCTGLTSITFRGTKAQWNAISKGSGWNQYNSSSSYYTIHFTVYCTDGNISY